MNRAAFIVLFTFISALAMAQSFMPIDEGSKVKFVIKNFGINTEGTLQGLSGTVNFDPEKLERSFFDVSVDVKTVNTDIESRDNHLRKPEYFDVEKFPKILFKSTKITKTNKPEYLFVFGQLTIKGITKEVKFPFSYQAKNGGYLFEGEFTINRLDFGVGGQSFSLSDELTVSLSVFAKKS
jgi:polyisoprenoid-binding protein YceI